MKRIMIACAGGMSSSLLAKNMVKAGEAKGYKIGMKVVYSKAEYDNYDEDVDIALFVTSVIAFSKPHLKAAKNSTHRADAVLIAPQVKYVMDQMKKDTESLGIKMSVGVIDMKDYGTNNGEAVLEQALKLIE